MAMIHDTISSLRVGAAVGETLSGPYMRKKLGLSEKSKRTWARMNVGGKYYAHSLLFPPLWGHLAEHYDIEKIQQYWVGRDTTDYATVDLLTFGEFVCFRRLNDELIPCTDSTLVHRLSQLVIGKDSNNGVLYKVGHECQDLEWAHILLTITRLNFVFEDKDISGIVLYNKMTQILCKFNAPERWYLTHIVENVFDGPIHELAASCDFRNIRYVLNKFKPANAVPLLNQVFTHPTFAGKMTAVVRLLELFEIDMYALSSQLMDTIAGQIIKIISWIMDKAGFRKYLCNDKVSWTSISHLDDEEDDIVLQSALPCGCYTSHCTFCGIFYCAAHKNVKCSCPDEYKHNHTDCQADCGARRECFFDSVLSTKFRSISKIKKHMYRYVKSEQGRQEIVEFIEKYDLKDYFLVDDIIDTTITELATNEMCGVHTLIVFCLCFRTTLHIEDNVVRGLIYSETAPVVTIRYLRDAEHFVKSENVVKPTHYLWEVEGVVPFRGPPVEIKDTDTIVSSDDESAADLLQIEAEEPKVRSVGNESKSDAEGISTVDTENPFDDEPEVPSNPFEGLPDEPGQYEPPRRQDTIIDGAMAFEPVKTEKGRRMPSFVSMMQEEATGIFEKITSWLQKSSVEIIQWFDENPFFSGIFSIIFGIASFTGLYVNLPTNQQGFAGIIHKFQGATRTMHYAQNGFKGIFSAVKDVLHEMREMLGISKDQTLTDFKESVAELLVKCQRLNTLAQTRPAQFINCGQQFLDFRDNYDRVSQKYLELSRLKDTKTLSVITPIWYQLSKQYENLSLMYTKFVNGSCTRQIPVCLYLCGPTGVGKSSMINKICNLLNEKSKREMKVFTVSQGTDHWNGFAQQDIIVFDDLNAVVGPEGDTQSQSMFQLITSAPYNPPQAALPDKNTMAIPKFVIVASNHDSLPRDTIVTNPEAWERRRHLFVRVDWPEHTKHCSKHVTKCTHMDNADWKRFAHLKLTKCDPIVTEDGASKGKSGRIKLTDKTRRSLMKTEGYITPTDITFEQMVDEMLSIETTFAQAHEKRIEEAIACGTIMDPKVMLQAKTWVKNPHTLFIGPPGSGKSHILQNFCETMDGNVQRIISVDDAEQCFSTDGTLVSNCRYVVIDDLSVFCNVQSDILDKIVNYVCVTSNKQESLANALIMGANEDQLVEKLGIERYEMFARRCNVLTSKFRTKNVGGVIKSIFGRSKMRYTYNDVKESPTNIYSMVKYHYKGEEMNPSIILKFLQQSICSEVKEVVQQLVPDSVSKLSATALVQFPVKESAAIKLINGESMLSLLSILSSVTIKKTKKSKLDPRKFLVNLRTVVNKLQNLKGVNYDSFIELLLVANQNKALEFFKGESVAIRFDDATFYIDYLGVVCRVGRLEKMPETFVDAVDAMKELNIPHTKSLVDTIKDAIFPPWISYAGDIFATVFQLFITSASVSYSVSDQIEMYAALRTARERQDLYTEAGRAVVEKADSSVFKKIGLKGLYPGTVNGKAPQYGIAADFADDISNDPNEEWGNVTPEDKKKKMRNARIYPGNWRESKEIPTRHEYFERTNSVTPSRLTPAKELKEQVKLQCSQDMSEQVAQAIPELIEQEAAVDPALFPLVSVVANNMGELYSMSGIRVANVLFLRNNLCTTVLHPLDTIEADQLRVRILNKDWPVKIVKKDRFYDRLDLEIDDRTFPMMKDITHHLCKKENIIMDGQNAVLVKQTTDISKMNTIVLRAYVIKNVCYKTFKNWNSAHYVIDYRGHRSSYAIESPIHTDFGDCGSVLILADPAVNHGKILGVHFAASTTIGYATPRYQSDYLDEPQKQCGSFETEIPGEFFSPTEDKDVVAYLNEPVYIPSKTKLYRNWFPIGEKFFEPSVLTGKDPRSTTKTPLHDEAKRWCVPRVELTDEQKQQAYEAMVEIAQYEVDVMQAHGVQLDVMTKTEAINKHRKFNHSEPVNTHTSPGFPWSKLTKRPGKQEFISVLEDGSRRFSNENIALKDRLHKAIDRMLDTSGPRPLVAFQVFLKDEARSLKRVYEETRTRTIAAAPLDFQIAYRMYFHAYHAAKRDHFAEFPGKVGIDPTSLDWHTLYMDLAGVSDHAVDLDFKGWDFNIRSYLVWLMQIKADMVYAALNPEHTENDSAVRRALAMHLYKFFIIVGNRLLRTTDGTPSGYPGTSDDNSDEGHLLIYLCYKLTMIKIGRRDLANYLSFREVVRCAHYGDDFIASICTSILAHFNGLSIAAFFGEWGLEAQPATKNGVIEPARPLKDCIFLSRHFRLINGIWCGPLQIDHLCKASWWVSDKRAHYIWESLDEPCGNPESVVSSYESMCYEAAIWGREFFEQVRSCALKVYRLTMLRLPPTWQECRGRMFGLKYIDECPGLIFHDISHLTKEFTQYGVPELAHRFSNRTAWSYGPRYTYSGIQHQAMPHTRATQKLLDDVNDFLGKEYNSILVNKYPVGGEIPWHKDNEPELDTSQGVFGVTMKGDGRIEFKNSSVAYGYSLKPGLGYLMEEENLKDFSHRRIFHFQETISFTFRKLNALL